MTRVRSLEQTLADNLAWNRARIKFVARFLLALYSQRTVNLTRLATAWSGHASEASNYKRLQRFLHSCEIPYAEVAQLVIRWLGAPSPDTLALDRTNWKIGKVEVNILLLSVVYRGIGFPLVWCVLPHAGNSDTNASRCWKSGWIYSVSTASNVYAEIVSLSGKCGSRFCRPTASRFKCV